MRAPVAVGLVTWNSAAVLDRCLDAVRRQTIPLRLLVVDNRSADGTQSILERRTSPDERLLLDRNSGFSAAHNLAIARTSEPFYLCLNPDVFLSDMFLEHLVSALERHERAGAASGKLLRDGDPPVIDSAGMYMTSTMRHLDRGAGEPDRGRFDRSEQVFGASGAAALYRRAMLDDVRVAGEVFDEDFFAYREDADLAWRAQLLGWPCLYVPDAVAVHVRRVTPDRRLALPPELNRASVRNRFLLRMKNQTTGNFLKFLLPALWRDLQVIAYVILREQRSIPAFVDLVRLMPRTLAKRRAIMARRRADNASIDVWFRRRAVPGGQA
jgi:GT2 family glycosyltransferase